MALALIGFHAASRRWGRTIPLLYLNHPPHFILLRVNHNGGFFVASQGIPRDKSGSEKRHAVQTCLPARNERVLRWMDQNGIAGFVPGLL